MCLFNGANLIDPYIYFEFNESFLEFTTPTSQALYFCFRNTHLNLTVGLMEDPEYLLDFVKQPNMDGHLKNIIFLSFYIQKLVLQRN